MIGTMGTMVGFVAAWSPPNWENCEGQVIQIAGHYQALFSLLKDTYGGDGRTTFALPDFRGRVGVSVGQGPGMSNYKLGQKGGAEEVALSKAEMPSHTHAAAQRYSHFGWRNSPENGYPARIGQAVWDDTYEGEMGAATCAPAGASGAHYNLSPYTTVNVIICTYGIYPSRS